MPCRRSNATASPLRAITLGRGFPVPLEDLWDAVTNGERIANWFLPISGELEPGGRSTNRIE